MATIQYTTYTFNSPQPLVESDYETLKEILSDNAQYNINPPSNFIEAFKGQLIFLGIGAFGFLLASLDLAEWLNWVGGIPAFLAFFSLFSFVPSLFSYVSFLSDKSSYYSNLQKDITKSKNYVEFENLRKERKWNLY
jgi:hypothetical protein